MIRPTSPDSSPPPPGTPASGAPASGAPSHRLSSALLGLVLPLVILTGAAAVAWSWKDALPDPVATH